jgi:hypothetical protein
MFSKDGVKDLIAKSLISTVPFKKLFADRKLKGVIGQSDSMAEFSARSSSAGFANVDLDDFGSLLGSRFACSRLAASFLSTKIAKLPLVDAAMK